MKNSAHVKLSGKLDVNTVLKTETRSSPRVLFSKRFFYINWSRNFPPFMKREDSFPCLQKPATGSYLEPLETIVHLQSYFVKPNFSIILPCTPGYSQWFLIFRSSHPACACISHLSHACYMLHRPYEPP